MNLHKTSLTKSAKCRIILNYIKRKYHKESRFVSKREIRKIFHVELYNYFQNIFDMYQQIDVDVPLCFCPKEYAKKKIIDYMKERVNGGIYPGRIELDNKLNIHVYSYFDSMKSLYLEANVDYSIHIKQAKQDRFHSQEKIEEQKLRIVRYIKERNKKGYFAGVHEIQHNLKLNFSKYFSSSKEAYKKADINYQRVCPIILGKNKEKALTKIVLYLLVEMGYTIERTSIFASKNFNRGPDIEILDKNGNKILVEIKAYHKRYWITTREIQQLKNYMGNGNISKGIFITTSNKVNHNPKNIMIINGERLIELLQETHLEKFVDRIKWIQEEKVNQIERHLAHNKKREKIINYVQKCKKCPSQREIEKTLRLSLKTYFSRPPYRTLIKELKKVNNGNVLLCKDPQQVFQDISPVRE